MGVPMVGKRHQRKTDTSQGCRLGDLETISDRIGGTRGSRRSSVNDQQSLEQQEPAANHGQHALGALLVERSCLSKQISTQDAYLIYAKNWILPRWGKLPSRRNQDRRGGALATSDRSGGWDQSQDQVRDVGFVFARRSVGVLWPQSDLFRNTGWSWGQERSEHWRTDQCETSEDPPWCCHRSRSSSAWRNWSFGTSCSCLWTVPWEYVKGNSGHCAGWTATSTT